MKTMDEVADDLGVSSTMVGTISALIDWGDGIDAATSLGITERTYRKRIARLREDTGLTTLQLCIAFERLRLGVSRSDCVKGFAR